MGGLWPGLWRDPNQRVDRSGVTKARCRLVRLWHAGIDPNLGRDRVAAERQKEEVRHQEEVAAVVARLVSCVATGSVPNLRRVGVWGKRRPLGWGGEIWPTDWLRAGEHRSGEAHTRYR